MIKIMKFKTILVTAAVLIATCHVNAQENGNNRRQRGSFDPTEMAERNANRLAKEMDLKDEAKEKFVNVYKEYQTAKYEAQNPKKDSELTDEQRQQQRNPDFNKMTADEAKALINETFNKQQAALDIDKTYYKVFSEMLTPQQTARIFVQQRRNRVGNMNGGMRGQGGPGGFGGQGGGFGGPGGGF